MLKASTRGYLEAVICGFGAFISLMDASLGQVIAPHVQTVLNMSQSDRQWLITALPFTMGAALLLGGRAVDYFGAKHAFVAGVLGFAVASAAAGLSTNGLQMIGCRIVQGLCAALLMPACLAIVSSASSDTAPRAKMFAIFGTVATIGPMAGMMLGGILMQAYSWRACLFANLVVAVPLACVAMAVILPRPARKQVERFNILHALLATAALALIIYGASRVGSGSSIILSTLAAEAKYAVPGIILFAVFIWAERQSRNPLVKLSLLADRTLAFSLLALMVGGGGVLAVIAQLSFYMQNVLHYTPIQTGSALLPSSFAMLVGNPLTGFLVPRIGARKTFALGASLSSLGLFMLLGISAHSNYFVSVFPGLLISSLGLGISNMPGLNVIMSRVHANYAGIIGAFSSITSQVGMAFTITIINSITVASIATSLGEIGGYRMGLAVAAAGCLIGAVLIAVFVCGGTSEDRAMPFTVPVYGGFGLLIRADLCDGCLACEVACQQACNGQPGLRVNNNVPVPSESCDLCIARTQRGELPACVESCPKNCLTYGAEDKLTDQLVQNPGAVLFKPKERSSR